MSDGLIQVYLKEMKIISIGSRSPLPIWLELNTHNVGNFLVCIMQKVATRGSDVVKSILFLFLPNSAPYNHSQEWLDIEGILNLQKSTLMP